MISFPTDYGKKLPYFELLYVITTHTTINHENSVQAGTYCSVAK